MQVGEEVRVMTSLRLGYQAVWLGFVVPLLLMLAVIWTVASIQADEAVAALSGIVALIPYYILLYILRDNLKRKFTFQVEKINH